MSTSDAVRPAARTHDRVIAPARIVTPDGILEEGTVVVHDGVIAAVRAGTDPDCGPHLRAEGALLLPGFIDLHSDVVEKWIQPRPGGRFPLDVAMVELDKHLASCGVTTMYHCFCFGYRARKIELRRGEVTAEIVRAINRMAARLTIRHRIHARFEMIEPESAPLMRTLIEEGEIHLFSIMDHTPGQGQFTSLDHFRTYYAAAHQLSAAEAEALARERQQARALFQDDHGRDLTALGRARGLPMASHDDDTPDKVRWVHGLGIGISEFVVTLAAAREAHRLGMGVLMGAPNVLRGRSLTDNLSGREAIAAGCCTLLGSDYAPMSLLHAVFVLHRETGIPLHEAVNTVTHNAARAIGEAGALGAVREGGAADLVLVDANGPVPRVLKTFVRGREVFSTCPL